MREDKREAKAEKALKRRRGKAGGPIRVAFGRASPQPFLFDALARNLSDVVGRRGQFCAGRRLHSIKRRKG